ncbi:ATP-grasp domain-containing protein [Pseudonocardia sp. McavD-2-B]|uniref:ATP-grasp domain-containing protein n=1 Tax=Pseudonocardia sp. McavD-2-B TaxID=2954499 RepID=UPI002098296A|nr:ATP-grasp domain-containing protein [Pseudonocardia sp. McavD-2-B]MCO7193197.1 ATP-grasp domain-containing protein [Pseudonocardia sp. McavD-2-B]
MNVLLTCAGRRHYLVEYFRAALTGIGAVVATDVDAAAPAMQAADRAVVVPPVADPGYVEHLVAVCREHEIGLLLSLNDLELPVLAPHRARFAEAGTRAVLPPPDVVDICADKWRTFGWLTAHGIPTARTVLTVDDARAGLDAGLLDFPLVVKPRWGTASIGIEVVADLDELMLAHRLAGIRVGRSALAGAGPPEHTIVVQQMLPGHEHGMDVVNDLDGRVATVLARRKLTMRGGETDRAVTVARPELEELGTRLGRALGHIGNLDVDVFVDDDGHAAVLELNARFGGGYPFSHHAGADVPAALLAWASGRSPDPRWLTAVAGVRSAKYDRLVGPAAIEVPDGRRPGAPAGG